MIRVNIALVAAVVGTAFALVHTQYQSRRLYAAVDKARAQAAELDIEWESLRAQRRAAAAPARVQRIARSELNMRSPNASTTIYLKPSESAGAQK